MNLDETSRRVEYYENYRKPKVHEILEYNIPYEYVYLSIKEGYVLTRYWRKNGIPKLSKESLEELYSKDELRTTWFPEKRLIKSTIFTNELGYVLKWMHKMHCEKFPNQIIMLEAMPMKTKETNNTEQVVKYTTDELKKLKLTKQIIFNTSDPNIKVLRTPFNLDLKADINKMPIYHNECGYFVKGYDITEFTQFRQIPHNSELHEKYFNIDNIQGTDFGKELRYFDNLNSPQPQTSNTLYKYVDKIFDYPEYKFRFQVDEKIIEAKNLPEAQYISKGGIERTFDTEPHNQPVDTKKSLKSKERVFKKDFNKVPCIRIPYSEEKFKLKNKAMTHATSVQLNIDYLKKFELAHKRNITRLEKKEQRREEHLGKICVKDKEQNKIFRGSRERASSLILNYPERYSYVSKQEWKEYNKRLRKGLFNDGLHIIPSTGKQSVYTGINRRTRRNFLYHKKPITNKVKIAIRKKNGKIVSVKGIPTNMEWIRKHQPTLEQRKARSEIDKSLYKRKKELKIMAKD